MDHSAREPHGYLQTLRPDQAAGPAASTPGSRPFRPLVSSAQISGRPRSSTHNGHCHPGLPRGSAPDLAEPACVYGSIILLFGAPATGKSSLAREILTWHRAVAGRGRLIYLGTDALRETLTGKDYLRTLRPTIYRGLRVMAESAVLRGHHVLLDGNYLEPHLRRPILNLAKRHGLPLLKVMTCCELAQSLRRNRGRTPAERVPDQIVELAHQRQQQARAEADRIINTEQGTRDAARQIVEWLIGSPLTTEPDTPDPGWEEWRQAGSEQILEPGQTLWTAGQPSQGVAFLLEGQLEVIHQQPGRPDVVLVRLHPPETLGELSTLEGAPHSATVRAAVRSRLRALPLPDFRHMLSRHPSLVEHVLRGMGSRIRALSQTAGAASVDPLTGLGNRRLYDDLFPAMADHALQHIEPLSLALFDIDRFKGINDGFGHQVGDQVLRCLGQLIRHTLQPPALGIRLGGDEFIALFPNCDGPSAAQQLQLLAQHLRSAELPIQENVILRPTLSAGIATLPTSTTQPQELLRLADEAAYHSKNHGRDRITLWPP